MDKKIVIEVDVKHCSPSDIGLLIIPKTPEENDDAERLMRIVTNYLNEFAAPIYNNEEDRFTGTMVCLKCGSYLNGVFGSFTWGIVHGDFTCSKCGWPGRAYHYIEDEEDDDDEDIFNMPLQIILQYHPDFVSQVRTEGNPEA